MLITKIYQPDQIQAAAKELQLGELVAFPTETVYGLGADATNQQAVKRVYLAKGRPSDNPLIVTVANQAMVERFTGPLSGLAQKIIRQFWPGPLTLIFKIKEGSLPEAVTGGLKTAAFRMPANQVTRDLIAAVGNPLVGPSANSSGKPSPTTAQHVFHDLEGRIAGIVDDGPTQFGVESTILDLSVETPTVLRPGGVSVEELEAFLGQEIISDKHKVGQKETPKAPGMKYKHYAPSAQVLMVKTGDWPEALDWAQTKSKAVAILADQNIITTPGLQVYDLGSDVAAASHALFAGLRHFDQDPKIKYILAQTYSQDGLGAAYMNRLNKSAGEQYFSKTLNLD
ncbi:threonylcarbamoyl-AMP synthase [Ligilactobacillus equi]|uniref:L-threonylcarbamoyladenylate synthase n=1 Tax=Ligilactobacillus equi TaxID=137357 RepID=UPI002ED39F8F